MKTICQVIDYGGRTGGSFIPALESLSKAAVGYGHQFVVIATNVPNSSWPDELRAAGAQVELVVDAAEVTAALRRLNPSIIHSHFTRFDVATLRSNKQARLFWHVHSHRENTSLAARARALLKYRLLGQRVEAIVAVSKTLANECVEYFAPRSIVRVIQNGIDTERFRPPTTAERKMARQTYGFHEDDRVVLFFERVAYKGGATVRAAMRMLPEFRLLVAGGTEADRDRFGDAPNVTKIERAADARSLYWASDVLAFASDNEAFGFVLAEAISCGLPVVASDIPIVHEICGGSDEVALFPVRDAPAMAAGVREVANRRGLGGRERMVADFNLQRWTADVLRLYDSE